MEASLDTCNLPGNMARPAGCSSDEFSDDDDELFCSVDFKKPVPSREPFNENTPKEEKLITAILEENLEEVKRIVNIGFNIDSKSPKFKNWTPLMHACYIGNFGIVKFLLENKASTQEHYELVTPLLCLCDSKNNNEDELIQCLVILVEYGADVNAQDWFRANALIYAIKKNYDKLVVELISLGCDINGADSEGWTPLFHAVKCGNVSLVKFLKGAGADVKKIDRRGSSLLEIAMENDYKEIEALLSSNKTSSEAINFTNVKNTSEMLSELPNQALGRLYGYQRDAVQWLCGIGLESLAETFLENNVQLNEILTVNDEELKRIGVMIDFDRKKITYCIKKFHEHSWGKNSFKVPSNDQPLDLCDAANILSSLLHSLHICSAATHFWKRYRSNEFPQENNYIKKSMKYIRLIEKENNALYKIVKEKEDKNSIVPSDLILPEQKSHYFSYKLALFAIVGACFIKICISRPSLLTKKPNLKFW